MGPSINTNFEQRMIAQSQTNFKTFVEKTEDTINRVVSQNIWVTEAFQESLKKRSGERGVFRASQFIAVLEQQIPTVSDTKERLDSAVINLKRVHNLYLNDESTANELVKKYTHIQMRDHLTSAMQDRKYGGKAPWDKNHWSFQVISEKIYTRRIMLVQLSAAIILIAGITLAAVAPIYTLLALSVSGLTIGVSAAMLYRYKSLHKSLINEFGMQDILKVTTSFLTASVSIARINKLADSLSESKEARDRLARDIVIATLRDQMEADECEEVFKALAFEVSMITNKNMEHIYITEFTHTVEETSEKIGAFIQSSRTEEGLNEVVEFAKDVFSCEKMNRLLRLGQART